MGKHHAKTLGTHLARPCWEACALPPKESVTLNLPAGRGGRTERWTGEVYPNHSRGDVRRCHHGNIWFCTGNQAGRSWIASGMWIQLDPLFNPIRYIKARKTLQGADQ